MSERGVLAPPTNVSGLGTIYIAGHTGLVGSVLHARLAGREGLRVLGATRSEVDLTDNRAVEAYLGSEKPDIVVIAAGRVGGILANSTYPAEFLYQNLMIEANLIHGAWKTGVRRLLNFGSTCMYPKQSPSPMTPDRLMTGPLEATSEPYAIAKLAGLGLCSAYNRQYGTSYITAIPCTLYGPGDSFDPVNAHVVSALVRKFHDAREQGAREVVLWGTGAARREFLYVDDVAEACEILLRAYDGPLAVNVGSGESHAVREIAALIAEVVGFEGAIRWDHSRPDGAPDKLLASDVMRGLGWSPRTDLRRGLERTYRWFCEQV